MKYKNMKVEINSSNATMFNNKDFEDLLKSKLDDAQEDLKESVRDALIYGLGVAIIEYDASTGEITVQNKKTTDIVYVGFKNEET